MGLPSPRDSRFTTKPDAGPTEYDTGDGQELKWEFDEEHGRMYVTYLDDQ